VDEQGTNRDGQHQHDPGPADQAVRDRALRRGELNEAILVQPTSRQANAAMTYGLLGSLFEYRDLGAVEVNDGSRPVLAWRVVRPSVVASRFEA
jgi:hypothetical protein